MSVRLGPAERKEALRSLVSKEFDVVVIGGGVTGAGVALDAASRGLSVALLERRDFAAGTSSRSSKLLHGGLRYLEQLDFGLVREALHERSLILKHLAPHLARPVPFMYPLKHRAWERAYVGAGVILYDALAGLRAAVPRHRHFSRSTAMRLSPDLDPDSLVGAIQYYDGQVDDARFVVNLVRTAAHYGVVCASAVNVTEFHEESGRICAVTVVDAEAGESMQVRGRVFVNATGVWTTRMEQLAGVENPLQVRASKGVHILVPRDRIASSVAWILRTEKSVLFLIPWDEHWVIGTTDTPWDLDLDHPSASAKDVNYLLEHVNLALRQERALTWSDVVGVYIGLRPLVLPPTKGDAETTKISREHIVRTSKPGLVTVAGGKYTTYRVMAADAVDQAAKGLPFPVQQSTTAEIPLLGAAGYVTAQARAHQHPVASIIGHAAVGRLLRRYGSLVFEVFDIVERDPRLGETIPGAPWYLLAEAEYAASVEGALHLEDVLTRRVRVSIEAADRGRSAAPVVARIMGDVLGWSAEQCSDESDRYIARLDAESAALSTMDDEAADRVRVTVRDPRWMG